MGESILACTEEILTADDADNTDGKSGSIQKKDLLILHPCYPRHPRLKKTWEILFLIQLETDIARSIAASSVSRSTGLTKCSKKPACRLFSTSPFMPKPLMAMPRIPDVVRNRVMSSKPL